MRQSISKAVEQALEKANDILESADLIKGREFVNKARVVFLAGRLLDMVEHSTTCTSLECKTMTEQVAKRVFTAIVATSMEGMSESDCNEFTNLGMALHDATDLSHSSQRN